MSVSEFCEQVEQYATDRSGYVRLREGSGYKNFRQRARFEVPEGATLVEIEADVRRLEDAHPVSGVLEYVETGARKALSSCDVHWMLPDPYADAAPEPETSPPPAPETSAVANMTTIVMSVLRDNRELAMGYRAFTTDLLQADRARTQVMLSLFEAQADARAKADYLDLRAQDLAQDESNAEVRATIAQVAAHVLGSAGESGSLITPDQAIAAWKAASPEDRSAIAERLLLEMASETEEEEGQPSATEPA